MLTLTPAASQTQMEKEAEPLTRLEQNFSLQMHQQISNKVMKDLLMIKVLFCSSITQTDYRMNKTTSQAPEVYMATAGTAHTDPAERK